MLFVVVLCVISSIYMHIIASMQLKSFWLEKKTEWSNKRVFKCLKASIRTQLFFWRAQTARCEASNLTEIKQWKGRTGVGLPTLSTQIGRIFQDGPTSYPGNNISVFKSVEVSIKGVSSADQVCFATPKFLSLLSPPQHGANMHRKNRFIPTREKQSE